MGAVTGLEARDLELWRGDRRLFTKLSFAVRPGELLHVEGPNGAGKTSLLRVLCGASPPEEGGVYWNAMPIASQRLEYHAALAWLGHRDGLKQDLTAAENLSFVLALRTARPEGDIAAALTEAGLARAADLPVRALSAGQRRRVAMARCMLSNAMLWILDEPFANLDAAGRAWGLSCLGRHLERQGMVVITSHQSVEVAGRSTRRMELTV